MYLGKKTDEKTGPLSQEPPAVAVKTTQPYSCEEFREKSSPVILSALPFCAAFEKSCTVFPIMIHQRQIFLAGGISPVGIPDSLRF